MVRSVSQPSTAPPKQSAKPASQVPRPQAKPEQIGLPLATEAQALVQAPQLAASLARLTSQPSRGSPLQSAYPASHPPMAHAPPSHLGKPCGTSAHFFPHIEQLFTSVASTDSQPLQTERSQSA